MLFSPDAPRTQIENEEKPEFSLKNISAQKIFPPPLLVSKSVNLHLKWSLAASIMVDSWMLQHQLPITALHSVELLLLLTPAQALSIALAPPPWNTAAVGGYCREKLDCWQQLFLGRAVRGWIYSDPPPFIDHNKQHTVMTTIHSENHTF